MTRAFLAPHVGCLGGDNNRRWDRNKGRSRRSNTNALRGERSVETQSSSPKHATVLVSAAMFATLARSVNAAVNTPSERSTSGKQEIRVIPNQSAEEPPVDAEAHAAAANFWHAKWENAFTEDNKTVRTSDASVTTLKNPPGFHLTHVHPTLRLQKMVLLGTGVTSPPEPSRRVLVPLCGASADMTWLAACGHRVIGVELSGAAARGFFDAGGLPRTTSTAGGIPPMNTGGIKKVHISGNISIVEGDVFSLEQQKVDVGDTSTSLSVSYEAGENGDDEGHRVGDIRTRLALRSKQPEKDLDSYASYSSDARVGSRHSISFTEECLRFAAGGGPAFDAVWDRGALVAVDPSMRSRYANVIAQRIAPGGRILLVTTEYEKREETHDHGGTNTKEGSGTDQESKKVSSKNSLGPPFSVSERDVRSLYEPLGLTVSVLGSEDATHTAPPRMASKITEMRETTYLVEKPLERRRR